MSQDTYISHPSSQAPVISKDDIITLLSTETGKRFILPKQTLIQRLPYFESLFNSRNEFADNSDDIFQIEPSIKNINYKIETLFFDEYLSQPSNDGISDDRTTNVEAELPFLRTLSLSDLIVLQRTSLFYGAMELSNHINNVACDAWKGAWRLITSETRPIDRDAQRFLVSFLKAARALRSEDLRRKMAHSVVPIARGPYLVALEGPDTLRATDQISSYFRASNKYQCFWRLLLSIEEDQTKVVLQDIKAAISGVQDMQLKVDHLCNLILAFEDLSQRRLPSGIRCQDYGLPFVLEVLDKETRHQYLQANEAAMATRPIGSTFSAREIMVAIHVAVVSTESLIDMMDSSQLVWLFELWFFLGSCLIRVNASRAPRESIPSLERLNPNFIKRLRQIYPSLMLNGELRHFSKAQKTVITSLIETDGRTAGVDFDRVLLAPRQRTDLQQIITDYHELLVSN